MKRNYLVVLLSLLVLISWVGCNKDKDEVDQLEKEVLEAENNDIIGDSMAANDTASGVVAKAPVSTTIPRQEFIATPVSTPQPGGFTVQVGSGQNRENIENLAQIYKTRGYEPFITEVSSASGTIYRLRLGSFATREEAQQLAGELKDKYSIECWIDINR